MTLYEVERLSHRYQSAGHPVPALSDVDLVIEKGEFMAICGPSGSGKTTLLNILGLLEPPCAGTIRFAGNDISRLTEGARTVLRRERIAFVFQALNLIPVLSAHENVEYGLAGRGMSRADVQQRVARALDAVGVSAQAHQRPNEMSGGQRQRVAIARALVRDPEVILADEPTAALDQGTGLAVVEEMKRLNRVGGVTVILSTHDAGVLAAADRVVRLRDGRVIA
jgi:putative ABC transport system ATP-binding protein